MKKDRSPKKDSSCRLKRLTASLATILGLSSPAAFATVFVTNCDNAGLGSLRSAVASAPAGETVDASKLDGVCSRITLTTGAINVDQSDLFIKGPGAGKLLIAASDGYKYQYNSRIFTHTGTGLLRLDDITVTEGFVVDPPLKGGCIYSKGDVFLKNSTVTACVVKSSGSNGVAIGGGVFAVGSLAMLESTLSFNRATSDSNSDSGKAGGVSSNGFLAYYSAVVNNIATNSFGTGGVVGGVLSFGNGVVRVVNSTIARNKAGTVGGIFAQNSEVKILNSTISSNSASGSVGGASIYQGDITISNSTITANVAGISGGGFAPGLSIMGTHNGSAFLDMQSSIVANNFSGSSPAAINYDFGATYTNVIGSNNLVQTAYGSLPDDTLIGKCSFLGPLKNNGGLTETHKPRGHSPAIDAGNNVFGMFFDQRGQLSINAEKSYPREIGPPGTASPRADMGAFEIDRADEIYDADFDSC